MNRKLNKLFITIITILTVSLLAGFLRGEIDAYYKGKDRLKNILLGMAVLVAVYYPMTALLNKYFQGFSKKILSGSKKISKSSTLGMIIGFSIVIFVLFLGYAKLWYDWNVIGSLLKKIGIL